MAWLVDIIQDIDALWYRIKNFGIGKLNTFNLFLFSFLEKTTKLNASKVQWHDRICF